jgi:hypothetical protein
MMGLGVCMFESRSRWYTLAMCVEKRGDMMRSR